MKKPNDFDTTTVNQSKEAIVCGAHYATILNAEEVFSKAGNEMLKIAFDFDTTDSQAGLFMERYKNDTRNEKKWPAQAYMYIVSTDKDGNTSRNFKNLIDHLEKSNPGLKIKWGEDFGPQLKGKKIGVVFRQEEYINNNGEKSQAPHFCWTCSTIDVPTTKEPNVKYLSYDTSAPVVNNTPSGYVDASSVSDMEIPFN